MLNGLVRSWNERIALLIQTTVVDFDVMMFLILR